MPHSSLILATANEHKVRELRAMLRGLPLRVVSAHEAGFTDDIEETGSTLEENALLKARALNLDAEQRRERIMRVQIAFPFGLGRSRGTTPSD